MSSDADKTACDATPSEELRRQIMDSRVPKNEREWWASREIERLERWKSEQLLVESKWNPQRVAQLLGIGLGQDIRPNIEPKIVALKNSHKLLLDACAEFVRKVENGKARSRRSYKQMKAAIETAKTL